MANPRVFNFDCSSWYWNCLFETFKLKTKSTVIKAGTIVNKDNSGKVEEWNISSSTTTGALYIVAETTVKDVDRCVCIVAGEVLATALSHPSGVSETTEKSGVSILDSMVLRSHINLV